MTKSLLYVKQIAPQALCKKLKTKKKKNFEKLLGQQVFKNLKCNLL